LSIGLSFAPALFDFILIPVHGHKVPARDSPHELGIGKFLARNPFALFEAGVLCFHLAASSPKDKGEKND
jgi:hypothetical protein